jgi:K+-sensing histidine kinase KdpD
MTTGFQFASWPVVRRGALARQAERATEADRGRAALLTAVSHDLRAPLAAAKAAVSGIASPHPPRPGPRRPSG